MCALLKKNYCFSNIIPVIVRSIQVRHDLLLVFAVFIIEGLMQQLPSAKFCNKGCS